MEDVGLIFLRILLMALGETHSLEAWISFPGAVIGRNGIHPDGIYIVGRALEHLGHIGMDLDVSQPAIFLTGLHHPGSLLLRSKARHVVDAGVLQTEEVLPSGFCDWNLGNIL